MQFGVSFDLSHSSYSIRPFHKGVVIINSIKKLNFICYFCDIKNRMCDNLYLQNIDLIDSWLIGKNDKNTTIQIMKLLVELIKSLHRFDQIYICKNPGKTIKVIYQMNIDASAALSSYHSAFNNPNLNKQEQFVVAIGNLIKLCSFHRRDVLLIKCPRNEKDEVIIKQCKEDSESIGKCFNKLTELIDTVIKGAKLEEYKRLILEKYSRNQII